MSDSTHVWLTAASLVLGALGAAIAFLAQLALRQASLRVETLERKADAVSERLRLDELATKDLERAVAVERERNSGLSSQLTQRMTSIEGDIVEVKNLATAILQRMPATRSYSPPSEYAARKDPR